MEALFLQREMQGLGLGAHRALLPLGESGDHGMDGGPPGSVEINERSILVEQNRGDGHGTS